MAKMNSAELAAFLKREFPQINHMNFQIEAVEDDGFVRLRSTVSDQHLRPGGTVSGPTLMSLADCGLYLSILAVIGPVGMAVTTSLNMNFLRKPGAGDLIGESRLMKLGKRLAVGDVWIYSAGLDEPVAHATGTYSIPPQ
jgi:uncharacterized protein (TIGR00369 family)